MKHEEYSVRLHEELEIVRVSPALRQRTLAALQGKEKTIMKKKLTMALAFALAALLLGSVALAAASHWGLMDFVGQYGGTHVPSNAPDYIQRNVAAWETETMSIILREMYYDGRYLHAVLDMKAHDPHTLLISGMYTPQDRMTSLNGQWEEDEGADLRTIAQYWQDGGYDRLLAISPAVTCENDTAGACRLQEDGTLTFYLEAGYNQPQAVRDVELRLLIESYIDPMTSTMDSARDRVTQPLTLTVPPDVAPVTYICDTPQEFPEAGVRIDQLTIEALPLSLYATIEYSVIDEERFEPLVDGLWFEFIDPESTETALALQRLDSGFTSTGSIGELGGGRFTQRETLGANELHDTYTLRAYSAWTKERYETRTFVMHEAAKEELNDR